MMIVAADFTALVVISSRFRAAPANIKRGFILFVASAADPRPSLRSSLFIGLQQLVGTLKIGLGNFHTNQSISPCTAHAERGCRIGASDEGRDVFRRQANSYRLRLDSIRTLAQYCQRLVQSKLSQSKVVSITCNVSTFWF